LLRDLLITHIIDDHSVPGHDDGETLRISILEIRAHESSIKDTVFTRLDEDEHPVEIKNEQKDKNENDDQNPWPPAL